MRKESEHGKIGISKIEAEILYLLCESATDMYGLEMVDQSGHYATLKRGTVYIALERMEYKRYVTSEESRAPVSGFSRRLYKITGCGEMMLEGYKTMVTALSMREHDGR